MKVDNKQQQSVLFSIQFNGGPQGAPHPRGRNAPDVCLSLGLGRVQGALLDSRRKVNLQRLLSPARVSVTVLGAFPFYLPPKTKRDLKRSANLLKITQ